MILSSTFFFISILISRAASFPVYLCKLPEDGSSSSISEHNGTCTQLSAHENTFYDVDGIQHVNETEYLAEQPESSFESLLSLVNGTYYSNEEIEERLSEFHKELYEIEQTTLKKNELSAWFTLLKITGLHDLTWGFRPSSVFLAAAANKHPDSAVRLWQSIFTNFIRICREKGEITPVKRRQLMRILDQVELFMEKTSPSFKSANGKKDFYKDARL